MFVHRKNALKAHKHSSIQREHFKKTILIQNLIKIKVQDASNFSRRVTCPLACVQLISLFLYEKNHFFIQNAQNIH